MFSQAIGSLQPQNTLRDLLEFDFSWKYVLLTYHFDGLFLVFFPTWNNNNYQRLFPFCFIIADERIGLAFLIKSYFSLEVEGAFEGARTWPFSCCNLVKKGRLLMRQRTKCVTYVLWGCNLRFFSRCSLFCYCSSNTRVCLQPQLV